MNNIQISNVFLWQKNGKLRNLEFLPNRVNVITGDSGKGKSSILFIIDYCLLATETKGISKTNIDSKVNWYGIKISVGGNELVIARPSESNQEVNGVYFSTVGLVPEVPVPNTQIDNLKSYLNTAFGIDSEMRVPYGGRTVKAGSRVSFRNFLAFCYQDQSTITAPDYLFIRPADERYQELIERCFRMAIGAENVKTAIVRARLADLERKKISQERKYEIVERSIQAFSEEIQQLYVDAKSMGLIKAEIGETSAQVTTLRRILAETDLASDPSDDIARIDKQIFALRARNRRLRDFLSNRESLEADLEKKEDALKPIEVFNKNYENILPSVTANAIISALQSELAGIKTSIKSKKSFPFLKEIEDLLEANESGIADLQAQRDNLSNNVSDRIDLQSYYRYLGKLEAKLDLYEHKEDLSVVRVPFDYDTAIKDLTKTINEDLNRSEVTRKRLNELINEKLIRLKLKGYPNFTAYFEERERLIHLHDSDLKTFEKMPDIGSASNYLYLHVAFFLALHQLALTLKVKWTPSFIILDQPSSPYYSDGKPNDDIRSLDAVLSELNNFVKEMDAFGGFQVILLEHIEESHWKKLELERFHLVDKELRGEYGLVLD